MGLDVPPTQGVSRCGQGYILLEPPGENQFPGLFQPLGLPAFLGSWPLRGREGADLPPQSHLCPPSSPVCKPPCDHTGQSPNSISLF